MIVYRSPSELRLIADLVGDDYLRVIADGIERDGSFEEIRPETKVIFKDGMERSGALGEGPSYRPANIGSD